MRIDSCRTCGENMKEFQRCGICSTVNKFVCRRCNKASDEQIHPECNMPEKAVILN